MNSISSTPHANWKNNLKLLKKRDSIVKRSKDRSKSVNNLKSRSLIHEEIIALKSSNLKLLDINKSNANDNLKLNTPSPKKVKIQNKKLREFVGEAPKKFAFLQKICIFFII